MPDTSRSGDRYCTVKAARIEPGGNPFFGQSVAAYRPSRLKLRAPFPDFRSISFHPPFHSYLSPQSITLLHASSRPSTTTTLLDAVAHFHSFKCSSLFAFFSPNPESKHPKNIHTLSTIIYRTI